MNRTQINIVVFTDLDGTLLDDKYDLPGAAYMLNELYRREIYTVVATSKTAAELETFQNSLTYKPPMIVENGGGVVWSEADCDNTCALTNKGAGVKSYAEICEVLSQLRQQHGFAFEGFADMSVETISERTGLDAAAACLAKQRQASEPISWADSPEHFANFKAHLQAHQLTLTRGGRFYHVMSETDKAVAARQVTAKLVEQWHGELLILACGDSANDQQMLNEAHGCVVFPGPDNSYLSVEGESADKPVVHAKAPGVLPWLGAVNQLINVLSPDKPKVCGSCEP